MARLEQPEAAAAGDRRPGYRGAEPDRFTHGQAARDPRGQAAAERVACPGAVGDLDVHRGNMRDPAVGQEVRARGPGLHDSHGDARRGQVTEPGRWVGGAGQHRKLLLARDEQIDLARQIQDPVGHVGSPGFVRIEGDNGTGSEPPHLRDDPLGMPERHGGHVHGGGPRERWPGEILRLRSYLLAAARRSPVEPPSAAVFLVDDPVAHRRPGDLDQAAQVHTRLSQRGKRAARKVISPPGDERRLGTCRDDGRRGVHAVAAQPRHPGDAGGENDIVDGEVSDDEHKLAVTRRNQRCQERFAHSGGISR